MMLCNCYHSKEDHNHFGQNGALAGWTWCLYSEYGQCSCDAYTPIDNLTYLEYLDEQKQVM